MGQTRIQFLTGAIRTEAIDGLTRARRVIRLLKHGQVAEADAETDHLVLHYMRIQHLSDELDHARAAKEELDRVRVERERTPQTEA